MPPADDPRLDALAEVLLRVGVNLQPGQPLLITEPYDLHGVHPEACPLVEALRKAATSRCPLGSEGRAKEAHPAIEVIPADLNRLRTLVETDDQRGFASLVRSHIRRLEQHLARGGAFLFLQGSQPQLFAGLPADRLAAFDQIKWRYLGPFIQRLVGGASQWTLAPAPSAAWADLAFADLPPADRQPALWATMFEAMRVPGPIVGGSLSPDSRLSGHKAPPTFDPISAWSTHLAALARHRDALNAARHRQIRYTGPGTDLTLDLPRSHVWCTAQLVSRAGIPFVANLPTEEVFTAPHQGSARGTLRVSRPVVHGGNVIDGIELEFRGGRVVAARARTGQAALDHLLATDSGAGRIGEVAIVPALLEGPSPDGPRSVAPQEVRGPEHVERRDPPSFWYPSPRLYHHALLDENAAPHVALGEAYRFCSRAFLPLALNRSQIHLDLPLEATVDLR